MTDFFGDYNFDNERFLYFRHHTDRGRRVLRDEDIAAVSAYLENPFRAGLWRLSAKWLPSSGVSVRLWDEISNEISGKDVVTIRSGKRERRIRVSDSWRNEVRDQVENRVTFIMVLFSSLARQAVGAAETERVIENHTEEEQLILDLIDPRQIVASYNDALIFFQDNIWHEEFDAATVKNVLNRLKSGPFIMQKGPRDSAELVLISWQRQPLDAMGEFLSMIGKISDIELMPIFSPEEEVFAPYLDFLGMVADRLIKQNHLVPVVSKALSNFREGNYSDCVSSFGLAAEDLLTQIFETLFREQLTKGLTLGQLLDEINRRTAEKMPRKEDVKPDLSAMYSEIRDAANHHDRDEKKVLNIMRNMLTSVIDSNKYILTKIDRFGKAERRASVFSDYLIQVVNEMIRYRNAASHRSRIPIGPYECNRSAYAFVVLHQWWSRQKKTINWNKSADEIVLEMAASNASA
jgi:hypothetical protein